MTKENNIEKFTPPEASEARFEEKCKVYKIARFLGECEICFEESDDKNKRTTLVINSEDVSLLPLFENRTIYIPNKEKLLKFQVVSKRCVDDKYECEIIERDKDDVLQRAYRIISTGAASNK